MKKVVIGYIALNITLVIAFLCPRKVYADDTISVTEFNSNNTVRDLDVEYYVTGGTFSGTFTLTGNFDLPDGTITSADPVYSGTCIPASGTNVSDNMQSCALTPRVNGQSTQYGHHESYLEFDDSSAAITLSGSPNTSQQVVVSKISYMRVQQITVRLSDYTSGRLYVKYTTSASNWYLEPVSNVSLYKTTRDNVTYIRCGVSNQNFIQFNIVTPVTSTTSVSTASILSMDGTYINELVKSEFPVSDETSHEKLNLIQTVLNGISSTVTNIKDLLNNAQQGVDDLNDDLSDTADQLGSIGSDMHSTETDLFDDMDSALSNSNLNLNISSIIGNSNKPKAGFKWVADQMQYIAIDLGTGITDYWSYIFLFPLVLGIAFIIVGRLK